MKHSLSARPLAASRFHRSRMPLSVLLASMCTVPMIAAPRLVHAAPVAASAQPHAVRVSLLEGRTLQLPLPLGASWSLESGNALQGEVRAGVLQLQAVRGGVAVVRVQSDGIVQRYAVRVLALAQPQIASAAQMSETRPEGVGAAPETRTNAPQTDAPNSPPVEQGAGPQPAEPAMTLPHLPAIAPANDAATSGAVPSGNIVMPVFSGDAPRISASLPAPTQQTGTAGRNSLPRNVARAVAARNGRAPVTVTQGLARLFTFPANILAVFFSDTNVMDARAINARTVAVTGAGLGDSTLAVFTARYPGDAVGKANIFRVRVGEGPKTKADNPANLEAAIVAAIGDPRVRVTVIRSPRGNAVVRLSGSVREAAEATAASSLAGLYVPTEQIISSISVSGRAPTLDEALTNPAGLSGGTEAALQNTLRRFTGNDSIEIVPLPTGLGVKAIVESASDAEAILNLVPIAPDRPILPFIVIRGLASQVSAQETPRAYYQRAALTPEDQAMSRTLQGVTGVTTVYVTRTATNGIAIYGTARNRQEYETVRRYGATLGQTAGGAGGGQGAIGQLPSNPGQTAALVTGVASTAVGSNLRPLGTEGALAANSISTGNRAVVGVQYFVRILDPRGRSVRRINVQASLVEINRTAARKLGVEIGSVSLLSENITRGVDTIIPGVAGSNGSPSIPSSVIPGTTTTTRTIDPTFGGAQLGSFLAGNGFVGGGGLANINPIRARINALYSNGYARLLSQPNLSAVEGAEAQITIGGQRPVPSSAISGNGGAVGQSVEFRRFGIILTMRPTLTDDDTIILQIRTDVSSLDATSGINLGGAFIPGESVRSIDTTVTLRDGDTLAMGGLMTNDRRQNTSRIPILSQIPIIGALFKSKQFENNQSELAIFMTPHIDRMPASMNTQEDVSRVPALPPLPGVQQRNEIFAFGGGQ